MEKKRSVGVLILAIFFILLGFCIIALGVSVLTNSNRVYLKTAVEKATISTLETVVESRDEYLNELKESGSLDDYDSGVNNLKQLLNQAINTSSSLPSDLIVVIVIGFISGILFILSGIGLIKMFAWSRKFALIAVFSGCLYYFGTLYSIYLLYAKTYSPIFIQIDNLAVILDSNYQVSKSYSNIEILKSLLLTFPVVLLHCLVIVCAGCIFFYFTRPKVREQFE